MKDGFLHRTELTRCLLCVYKAGEESMSPAGVDHSWILKMNLQLVAAFRETPHCWGSCIH